VGGHLEWLSTISLAKLDLALMRWAVAQANKMVEDADLDATQVRTNSTGVRRVVNPQLSMDEFVSYFVEMAGPHGAQARAAATQIWYEVDVNRNGKVNRKEFRDWAADRIAVETTLSKLNIDLAPLRS